MSNEFVYFSEYLLFFVEFFFNCEIFIFDFFSVHIESWYEKYQKFVNFDLSKKNSKCKKMQIYVYDIIVDFLM